MTLEMKVPVESWLAITCEHPELVVECSNLVELAGGELLGEFEVYGSSEDLTHEIVASADVLEAENLEQVPGPGRYLVRFRRSIAAALAAHFGLAIRYPRRITKGILAIELIARRSQMGLLVDALGRARAEPRLVSLRRNSLRSVPLILTPTQRALFRQALGLGYYEVPRRITLTTLARKVARSKSSVSRTLAMVDRKLAEFAITALA